MPWCPPNKFIPLFEENGLIEHPDAYVWRDKYGRVFPVSVNVSRIDLFDPDLIETLSSLVKEFKIRHEDFLLEITESAYTEDSEQIIENVKKLRDAGFMIEMDDFGSGYSSLNMISTLPIDVIKLDMQFIRNAFKEQNDTRMLEAVLGIADMLYLPTVAEGVETLEQMNVLRGMGCDVIQGCYFSKPVPAGEYERFIEERLGVPLMRISFPSRRFNQSRRKKNEICSFPGRAHQKILFSVVLLHDLWFGGFAALSERAGILTDRAGGLV